LIWDYTDRKPTAINGKFLENGATTIINVLANDNAKGNSIVTILTAPTNG
jgi:hypothetical protein